MRDFLFSIGGAIVFVLIGSAVLFSAGNNEPGTVLFAIALSGFLTVKLGNAAARRFPDRPRK